MAVVHAHALKQATNLIEEDGTGRLNAEYFIHVPYIGGIEPCTVHRRMIHDLNVIGTVRVQHVLLHGLVLALIPADALYKLLVLTERNRLDAG